jgi:hypothetical protein
MATNACQPAIWPGVQAAPNNSSSPPISNSVFFMLSSSSENGFWLSAFSR